MSNDDFRPRERPPSAPAEADKAKLKALLRTPARGARTARPLVQVDRHRPLALSSAQQRLWFLWQLDRQGTAYNLTGAVRLVGPLVVQAFERSLETVVHRHEAFRTTFQADPSAAGGAVQIIHAPVPVSLPVEDLSGLPVADQARQVRQRLKQEASVPFDLEKGPLLRTQLLKLSDEEHVLMLSTHHVVLDIVSRDIFFRELCALYEAQTRGTDAVLPPLAFQYADFAAAEQRSLGEDFPTGELEYWRKQLAGTPLLDLPTDRPRPPRRTFRGGTVHSEVAAPVVDGLRKLAQRRGATLQMAMLAGWAALLSRYARQNDVCIGTPFSTRGRRELENIIGLFINTLSLRFDLSGNPTTEELITRIRRRALEAYENHQIPFERLVEALRPDRDLSGSPFFHVWFFFQNRPASARAAGALKLEMIEAESEVATFDLTLHVTEEEGGAAIALNYNSDLFEKATAERILRHYKNLVGAMVARPDAPFEQLALLDAEECRQLLVEWNGQIRDEPATLVHALIEAQCRRTPDAPALQDEEVTLSYAELDLAAERLAAVLQDAGVGPERLVGICAERSIEMMVALLAVLKAGGAYVPLDPTYPPERVADMVEDSGVAWVLVQDHLRGILPPGPTLIALDGAAQPGPKRLARPSGVTPEHLAYAIYTSGSTGRPKLALNTHGSVADRFRSLQRMYELTTADVVQQKIPFSFDASIRELFWPLIAGAKLLITRPDGHRNLEYIRDHILLNGVTVATLPVSMLRAFLELPGVQHCRSLRKVFCGAEALSLEIQERFFSIFDAELHNCYGVTEAACEVTTWKCQPKLGISGQKIPIGHPFPNTQVYILDRWMQPVPPGVPGELYAGGLGVGRGYHGSPDLTAERFIPDPFSDREGARLYRTGDLARFLSDGTIEYLGRIDDQVKVRGFRIELGEIEVALRGHPSVEDAVVIVREDRPGDRRLVGYLVPRGGGELPAKALREHLETRLPHYMVPAHFVPLTSLPLNVNGKVDRPKLPPPEATRGAAGGELELPRTAEEETLAAIWAEVLGVERIGIRSNFFELGGDSLLCLDVVSRAASEGLVFTPLHLFEHQTIAELMEVVTRISGPAAEIADHEPFPLSAVQQWFFEQGFEDPSWYGLRPILLEIGGGLDVAALQAALDLLPRRHASLRLRFQRSGDEWSQYYAPAGPVPLERVDLEDGDPKSLTRAILEQSERLHRGLDLSQGPLFRAALLMRPGALSDRLLLVMHHLVADAGSERVLIEDLIAAYDQIAQRQEPVLPPAGAPFGAFCRSLERWARSPEALAQSSQWLALADGPPAPLKVDLHDEPDTSGMSRIHVEVLDEETTRRLMSTAARPVESVLAATCSALAGWSGRDEVWIELSGHGKELSPEGVDIARTVGWFSSFHPLRVQGLLGASPGRAQACVRQALEATPGRGAGFGALRYLSSPDVRERLMRLPVPEVAFAFLGAIEVGGGRHGTFRLATEDAGPFRSPRAHRSHLLTVMAWVQQGRLHLAWEYGVTRHRPQTIAGLAADARRALEAALEPARLDVAGGTS